MEQQRVTVAEVAKILGKSQLWVREWLKQGRYARIPKVSFYAFCVQNVDSTRRLVAI